MENIQLQKIHAINKARKQQLLVKVFLFSLTVLTCSLLCSSHFWFPNFFSSMKLFLFVSVPKLGAIFLSAKSIFIVGNLIVIVLYGESKLFASSSPPAISDVYYNEYVNRKGSQQTSSTPELKGFKSVKESPSKICELDGGIWKNLSDINMKVEKERDHLEEEDDHIRLPAEELNKRADDFIARINRQFRLEAKALVSYGK